MTFLPSLVVPENKNEPSAVVYVLPEGGDPAGMAEAYRYLLGLSGKPDILLVGASALLPVAATAIQAATGCEVVYVPLPAFAQPQVPFAGDCKSTAYDRAAATFLVSELFSLQSISKYSLLLFLGAAPADTFGSPLPCDPFLAAHASGVVYASFGKANPTAPGSSPSCVATLKEVVESQASADKVLLNTRLAERQQAPALQILQVTLFVAPSRLLPPLCACLLLF